MRRRIRVRPIVFRVCSGGLAWLLVMQSFVPAVMAQVASDTKITALKISILEGEGAINNIRQRTAREPIVQVEDENNRPVAGAMVLFTLPDSGAGAVFPNGSKTMIAYTDSKGQAAAKGLKPNNTPGNFQIIVNATFQGLTAGTAINQTNVLAAAVAAGGISGKLIAILAIAGGAAAAGVVAATSGGNSNGAPATPPTIITAGSPTVEAPR